MSGDVHDQMFDVALLHHDERMRSVELPFVYEAPDLQRLSGKGIFRKV